MTNEIRVGFGRSLSGCLCLDRPKWADEALVRFGETVENQSLLRLDQSSGCHRVRMKGKQAILSFVTGAANKVRGWSAQLVSD